MEQTYENKKYELYHSGNNKKITIVITHAIHLPFI